MNILTSEQKAFLTLLSRNSKLSNLFYFSGGTALAHYYLQHRLSEDLDFFSLSEVPLDYIDVFLKSIQGKLAGFKKYDYTSSFNRNIFQLIFPDSSLKIEFTFFPFDQVEKPKKVDGLYIDSLIDIAVNKVFTISQQPRGRDYFDLYFIHKKTGWKMADLAKKAKIKFDWHVDPLHLGSQLYRVTEFLDDPILTDKTNSQKITKYIISEAESLSKKILK